MIAQLSTKLYAFHKRLGQNRAAYMLVLVDEALVPAVYVDGGNPPSWANKILQLAITGGHISLPPRSFAHIMFAVYEGEFEHSSFVDPRANNILNVVMRESGLLKLVQSRCPEFSLIRGIETSSQSLRSYLEWRFMN